jgi:galactosamine-6-phosphate isomerase
MQLNTHLPMEIRIFDDGLSLANHAAGEMARLARTKPDAVICLPSGNSPKETCEAFVRIAKETSLDTRSLFFLGLDEWVGVELEQKGSCRYDFFERVFGPLQIHAEQYHLFNGLANDLEAECRKMEQTIADKGGIDLMIVGIGLNGHIGFNEPGTAFELHSHIAELDAVTTSVGQQYFDGPRILQKGITLGPANVLEARAVFLLAQGSKKAGVIKQLVEGDTGPAFPASMIKLHSNSHLFIDREAAAACGTIQKDA